jgi:heme o synthase
MFMISFSRPHFWAFAYMRQIEDHPACVPMLPVIVDERETYRQIVLYSVDYALVRIALVFLRLLGLVYLALALLLNGTFLWFVIDIWRHSSAPKIWRLYRFSIIYLALLVLAMTIEHLFCILSLTIEYQYYKSLLFTLTKRAELVGHNGQWALRGNVLGDVQFRQHPFQ